MEVKILQKHDKRLRFFASGIDIPEANAIRRIMISDVPAMAITEVVIIENSSVMYDEVLAHRIGLIPLKTDLDSFVLPDVCSCGSELGCNKCSVSFTLNAEASTSVRTVYSGELKSINPDVVPASDKIPLLKLAPGQRIKLEAYAKLGLGKNHVKWQPVSVSSYKYVPEIKINRRKCDNCGLCVEICPKGVLKIVKKKLEIVSEENCTLCKDCEVVCPQSPSAIKIKNLKNAFIFNVESTGALPCERIVTEAVKILKKKSKEFAGEVSKIKDKKKRQTKKVK